LQEDVSNKFSCQGRGGGYYADVDSGCQVYHMCDGLGRQFSYSCPNTTLFQQRMLICDHWYMVNCSRSEIDYTANLLIGQQKPFVEDSEKQTYYRTPRPDLLTQPTASEINIIYRTASVRNNTDLNLVGINSDFDQNNGSSKVFTAKPAYQLPSRWSTEYFQAESTSPSSVEYSIISPQKGVNQKLPIPLARIPTVSDSNILLESPRARDEKEARRRPLVPVAKAIDFNSNNLNNVIKTKPIDSFSKKDVVVNFKSSFKATTPVFPTKEELSTTEAPLHDILNAPISEKEIRTLVIQVPDQINVNFKSLFKATTPVFPTKEELGTTESPIDDIINPPSSENDV
ncbi:Carbohydrate-binding protein, partial [Oryctes borbonicus]